MFSEIKDLIIHGFYSQAELNAKEIQKDQSIWKWYYLSRISELTGKFETAFEYAKKILFSSGDNNEKEVLHAIAIGYSYWRLFQFDQGFEVIDKVLQNDSVQLNNLHQGTLYNLLGLLHWKIEQNHKALNYFLKAVEIRKETPVDYSYSLNNIGNTYLSMNDMDNCLKYYNESMKIRKEIAIKPGIAASHNSLARYYQKVEDMDAALNHHKLSLQLWEEIQNTQFIAKSHRFLGSFYKKTRNINEAKYHFDLAVKLFETIPNPTDVKVTRRLMK